MTEFDFSPFFQQWVNVFLIWVGFSTVAGIMARFFIPGNDRIGPLAMSVIAMIGTMLGVCVFALIVKKSLKTAPCNPISLPGLLSAFVGVLVCLIIYRMVAKTMVLEYQDAYKEDE